MLALARTKEGTVGLQAPPIHELPFGTLTIERDPSLTVTKSYELFDLLPVSELESRGLQNRYWYSGIGAPGPRRPMRGETQVAAQSSEGAAATGLRSVCAHSSPAISREVSMKLARPASLRSRERSVPGS